MVIYFSPRFYTTRPFLKILIREVEALLRITELSFVFSRAMRLLKPSDQDIPNKIIDIRYECPVNLKTPTHEFIRRIAALNLHHDSITGTARRQVVEDYMTHLNRAKKYSKDINSRLLSRLIAKDIEAPSFSYFTTVNYFKRKMCILNSSGSKIER